MIRVIEARAPGRNDMRKFEYPNTVFAVDEGVVASPVGRPECELLFGTGYLESLPVTVTQAVLVLEVVTWENIPNHQNALATMWCIPAVRVRQAADGQKFVHDGTNSVNLMADQFPIALGVPVRTPEQIGVCQERVATLVLVRGQDERAVTPSRNIDGVLPLVGLTQLPTWLLCFGASSPSPQKNSALGHRRSTVRTWPPLSVNCCALSKMTRSGQRLQGNFRSRKSTRSGDCLRADVHREVRASCQYYFGQFVHIRIGKPVRGSLNQRFTDYAGHGPHLDRPRNCLDDNAVQEVCGKILENRVVNTQAAARGGSWDVVCSHWSVSKRGTRIVAAAYLASSTPGRVIIPGTAQCLHSPCRLQLAEPLLGPQTKQAYRQRIDRPLHVLVQRPGQMSWPRAEWHPHVGWPARCPAQCERWPSSRMPNRTCSPESPGAVPGQGAVTASRRHGVPASRSGRITRVTDQEVQELIDLLSATY